MQLERIFNKKLLKILFISSLFSIFVVGWSIMFPTMINEYQPFWHQQNVDGLIDDTFLIEVYNYHQENPVFAARPAVTWMIGTASTYTILSIPQSFVVMQFLLLIVVGVALIWCAQSFKKKIPVFTTLALFYLSFSVLFAFFAPIYTYDDFLQYILLFLSIGFAQRGKWVWYIPTMTAAIWVREPSLILLPSFLILWMKHISDWKKALIILAPAALYWLIQWSTLDPSLVSANAAYLQADRFSHWTYNTLTPERIREMIFSVVAVLALPLYIFYQSHHQYSKRFQAAIILAIVLNTSVAIIATRIQEARIIALPLLLLWPIWGQSVMQCFRQCTFHFSTNKLILSMFSLIAVWQFSFVWYQSTDVYAFDKAFQWYVFLLLLVLTFCISFKKLTTRQ